MCEAQCCASPLLRLSHFLLSTISSTVQLSFISIVRWIFNAVFFKEASSEFLAMKTKIINMSETARKIIRMISDEKPMDKLNCRKIKLQHS